MEKNLAIEGLEKERDFYFGKLRDIEVLAQEYESAEGNAPEFSQKVLGILYATEVSDKQVKEHLLGQVQIFPYLYTKSMHLSKMVFFVSFRMVLLSQKKMETIFCPLSTSKNTNSLTHPKNQLSIALK